MKVVVTLFAGARDAIGADHATVEVVDGANVGELRQALMERLPQIATLISHALFALDASYVDDEVVLEPGTEIACIPPVSGG